MSLRRILVAVASAALLLGPAPVRADAEYYPVFAADGTERFPYGHSRPVVTCRPLHVCDVTLGRQESVLNVAVGDSVRWIVASAQSGPGGTTPHVFVKPTDYGLQTNLVITTTRHTYYIDLTSAATRGSSRIAFYYPEEESAANAAAAASAHLVAASAPSASPSPLPTKLDFKYRMYGDDAILPHTVYSDGSHTYLLFEALPNDLPVAFAVAPDGSQQIVNYRLTGTTFVVDGLPTGIDLVLNAGTGKRGRGERRAHVRHA